jgi:hypothetical protein
MTLPTPDQIADATEAVYADDTAPIEKGWLSGVWAGAKVGTITDRKAIAKELLLIKRAIELRDFVKAELLINELKKHLEGEEKKKMIINAPRWTQEEAQRFLEAWGFYLDDYGKICSIQFKKINQHRNLIIIKVKRNKK